MTTLTTPAAFPLWNADHAATLDAPALLLYRSNLLGSDLRITNYGGGNTSAKITQKDPCRCCGSKARAAMWVP